MPSPPPKPRLARRRRLAALGALSTLIATVAAVLATCSVSLLPPSLHPRQLGEAAVSTRVMLAVHPQQRLGTGSKLEAQARRADLVANAMSSPPVLDRIARRIGVDPETIAATTEIDIGVPAAFREPGNERRANEILNSNATYHLDIQPRPGQPVFDVYAQAPSAAEAGALTEAAIAATNAELRAIARDNGLGEAMARDKRLGRPAPVSLVALGVPRGGALGSKAPIEIFLLTFLTFLAIAFGLLYLAVEARRGWRGERGPAPGVREPPAPDPADAWPHTTRVIPWLLAAFIAMLWLVPINAITISASLPIELKLDRILLPVIVVVWVLALAAGGRAAPRWRFTRIHAAIAIFVAVAFLSVIVNAVYLDHTLELAVAIKKLSLLAAFFTIFLIVASSIRPAEVRPFLTFMLAMGVICGLGIIWEYHHGTNLFYAWSAKLLPGPFHVSIDSTTSFDEIGRPAVIGPAEISLEAVAMLAMAFPIALVRLLQSKATRQRIVYGLAACILLGAMISTYRKSALLAPLSIVLVLIAFRRREMLRLAPLGGLMVLAIPILAPNALGAIINQFQPNRLGVSTVSDRVSDYDAIRPDLLSHPALGRGYGSYEHTSYRILDNDLLMRLVETGLIGLSAYVVMLVAIVAIAAPIIRARRPEFAGPALIAAGAATAFLVLSVLFDIMSFPHTPYLLMVLLGLFAVAMRGSDAANSAGVGAKRRTRKKRPAPPRPAPEEPERVPVPA
jgi:hypothetical protein